MYTIKKATLKDITVIAPLFDAYRQFYKKPSDLEGGHTFLKERLKNKESVIYLVSDAEGTAAGFTQLYPFFSSTRMKRVWLLNDLYVHSDHRKKGVAQQLIQAAKELAEKTNAAGVMLETELTNVPGNALYPKVGFKLNTESHFYFWER